MWFFIETLTKFNFIKILVKLLPKFIETIAEICWIFNNYKILIVKRVGPYMQHACRNDFLLTNKSTKSEQLQVTPTWAYSKPREMESTIFCQILNVLRWQTFSIS